MADPAAARKARAAEVLTKAALRAASVLGLSQRELAEIGRASCRERV